MKDENLTIENGVLTKCNNEATSITIPASVKEITKKAFIGCKDLKEIIYDGTMDDWNQLSVDTRVFIWQVYEDFIPADVIKCTDGDVEIDKSDWMDYDDMYMDARHWYEEDDYYKGEDIFIKKGVFEYCKRFVHSVDIPDGITKIADNAFEHCENIESIVVPDSVTKIGYHAFDACYNLESVVLGSGLKEIKGDVFSWCSALEEVTFNGTVSQWEAVKRPEGYEGGGDDLELVVKCTDGESLFYTNGGVDDDESDDDEDNDEDD